MAPSITTLSAQKLRELKNGETVTVSYAECDGAHSRVIANNFPKAVATTFSRKWSALFPPINKIKVADLTKPQSKSITIIGGNLDCHRQILGWMLSCCNGAGIHEFKAKTLRPYSNYFNLRESARVIGCVHLEHVFALRMTSIEEKQINSEDIRALYLQLPPDHETLKMLNEHVADHIFNRTLKDHGTYRTLGEEIPAFQAGLDIVLKPKLEERRKVEGEKRTKSLANETKGRQFKKYQEYHGKDKASTIHKVLTCNIVRHGHGSRPSYARLNLGEVGVDRDNFSNGGNRSKPSWKAVYGTTGSAPVSQDDEMVATTDETVEAGAGDGKERQQVPGGESIEAVPKNRNARRRQKRRDAARKAQAAGIEDVELDGARNNA